jgi:hypothetical protein
MPQTPAALRSPGYGPSRAIDLRQPVEDGAYPPFSGDFDPPDASAPLRQRRVRPSVGLSRELAARHCSCTDIRRRSATAIDRHRTVAKSAGDSLDSVPQELACAAQYRLTPDWCD